MTAKHAFSPAPPRFIRFMDAIQYYAEQKGEQTACIFQRLNVDTAERLSYADLHKQISQRAKLLVSLDYQQQCVALLYPAGLDFVVNFLACLAAGVVAVPLSVSRTAKQVDRILHSVEDASIQAILTTKDTQETLLRQFNEVDYPRTSSLVWLDEFAQSDNDSDGVLPDLDPIDPNDLAFIQYTSGSTSLPKGVMVNQHNIVDNQRAIQHACGHKEGLIAGGWLPQFHDMGLIGQMLQPLYLGGTFVSMPAITFIQRPRRWLELISHYRIHSSPAPNFGYEHCVKFIADREDLSHLDLSCWKIALNGSEPLSASVMANFSAKFAPYGFKRSAFFPCYGMAETTLFVSGGSERGGVSTLTLDKKAFEQGKIQQTTRLTTTTGDKGDKGKQVVNCGHISPHFEVKIVNPTTCQLCRDDEIGEIWIAGESVAQGYWHNPEQTRTDFQAQIRPLNTRNGVSIINATQYLRTGDMGFITQNDLYVTGRIKELLIIRGRNVYPYDIERTCNAYAYAAGHNGSAVFSIADGETETTQVAGIVEIKKRALNRHDHEVMKQDLRAAIMAQHNITLDSLHLVKQGTIPKTTSGKVKRIACQSLIATVSA